MKYLPLGREADIYEEHFKLQQLAQLSAKPAVFKDQTDLKLFVFAVVCTECHLHANTKRKRNSQRNILAGVYSALHHSSFCVHKISITYPGTDGAFKQIAAQHKRSVTNVCRVCQHGF